MRVADQTGQRAQVVGPHRRACGQHHRRRAVIEARGVAGGDGAALLERGAHARQLLERGVAADMLVDLEQLGAFAALDFNRHYLTGEAAFGDGASRTLLADQRQSVLVFAADAQPLCDVLGSDAHVHTLERIVEDAEHVVHRLHVAHAPAPAGTRQQVGTAAHGFCASTDGDIAVAQQQALRRRDDGLQAGTAEAVDVERGDFLGYAGIHRGHAGKIGIACLGGNDIAHHHMTDPLGGTTATLQGDADRGRGQFAGRGILERTSEGADCGSYGTDDVDFGAGHRTLR